MEKNLEKTVFLSELLELYGNLLSEKTALRLDYYLNQDYSLSEIAELENTSRNAIFESISKGIEKLNKLEDKLNFRAKIDEILDKLEKDGYQDIESISNILIR